MSIVGLISLLVAFAATLTSIVCFLTAHLRRSAAAETAELLAWGGRVGVVVCAAALALCCGLLVWAFFTGDMSLDYVLRNHSDASGADAWLFRLAGLWAGRQGSLLFWASLISIFACIVALRTSRDAKPLDAMALMVMSLVLLAFLGVLLFSEDNMPFALTDPAYFNEEGTLTGAASALGMNSLLEHWAMAIHPPTLFIGYAGLTVPFGYAIAALVVNDDSSTWVVRCTSYTVFSWLFLGLGIGLGAIWAYVVLGWGGYWGWDAVENASLLPWLLGVALIHSFTVYRQRGAFKRWAVMCACLTFAFVILGTFITRSGLVQSVHAFEGDPVSLALFLGLIVLSLGVGSVGLVARRRTFGVNQSVEDNMDSVISREAAYYINNLVMVLFAVLLAYMTLASALPEAFPFGGQALSAGTYNAIARPLGIAYGLLIAVCPLMGWRRTDARSFLQRASIPGICATALFVLLVIYFCVELYPSYEAVLQSGGSGAEELLEQGPSLYYNGLAIVGFAVASLLIFNALFMAGRTIRRAGATLRMRFAALGGSISHAAMGIILIGLIGSSMYVTEIQSYVSYDKDADTAESLTVQDFELVYEDNSIEDLGNEVLYSVQFQVLRDGQPVGTVKPSVQLDAVTQQQKLNASVITFPLEDLFVVYRGVNDEGAFSMEVRVNPLITVVWLGFALLMLGALIALGANRSTPREVSGEHSETPEAAPLEAP